MKKILLATGSVVGILAVLLILATVLLGGNKFSESVRDKTAGMNGSFEVTKSGLPVNWLVYTRETIKTGDYDLIIDTADYRDGKQSLKFLVRECSSAGGWLSPGLAQEYKAVPGETYRVSFWAKNDRSEFAVTISGVSDFGGEDETMVRSKETIDTWRQFEMTYTIPEKMKAIRFEMNILQPGTFWIDDIRIEKIDAQG